MAQERRDTPEKQLLRHIENENAKDAPAKSPAARRKGLSIFSLGAWRGRFSFFKQGFGRQSGGGALRQLEIKTVNKILALSIVLLIAYLSTTLYTSITGMKELPNLRFETKDSLKSTSFPEVSALKAISYYTEKVMERNIFKMGKKGFVVEEEIIIEPAADILAELTQNLRLVGISWSNNPDAMIEDTLSVRTFFVKRGQMIGKLKVQAIFKDKVILSYEGEEVELK